MLKFKRSYVAENSKLSVLCRLNAIPWTWLLQTSYIPDMRKAGVREAGRGRAPHRGCQGLPGAPQPGTRHLQLKVEGLLCRVTCVTEKTAPQSREGSGQ